LHNQQADLHWQRNIIRQLDAVDDQYVWSVILRPDFDHHLIEDDCALPAHGGYKPLNNEKKRQGNQPALHPAANLHEIPHKK